MTLKLERSLEVTKLCQDVFSYDHVLFVAAINKNGRIIDSKFRNDRTITNLSRQEIEMYFMQRTLLVSLAREFDYKIEPLEHIIIERDTITEFLFPFQNGTLIVVSDSNIIPRYLAKKISLIISLMEMPIIGTEC